MSYEVSFELNIQWQSYYENYVIIYNLEVEIRVMEFDSRHS